MAYHMWQTERKRSLVLSYNKALVVDIQRTMCLLGMEKDLKDGIIIQTIHSFIWHLFKVLGEDNLEDDFLDKYDEKKDELLQFIETKTISSEELNKLKKEHSNYFYFDYVFVDEAQDWPQNEINILKSIYDHKQIIVADGEDQYIRGHKANWLEFSEDTEFKPIKKTICLRMKKNLTLFVNRLAEKFEINDWDLKPNESLLGGNVIIYEGDLYNQENLITDAINKAKTDNNYPVDLLVCVPPKFNKLQHFLKEKKMKFWDGTNDIVRSEPCFDRETIRIVQYDSCRGLEGWTTFNFELDTFWNYKHKVELQNAQSLSSNDFMTPDEIAKEMTSKWMLIPLTRSMDTIIINLTNRDSFLKTSLKEICKEHDFVTWITI